MLSNPGWAMALAGHANHATAPSASARRTLGMSKL
jgi:hypothetical protein